VPVPSTYLQALDFIHDVKAIQKQPRKRSSLLWPISRMTGYRWVCETMELAGVAGQIAHPHGLRHAFGVQAFMTTRLACPLSNTRRTILPIRQPGCSTFLNDKSQVLTGKIRINTPANCGYAL
jgi:integrase